MLDLASRLPGLMLKFILSEVGVHTATASVTVHLHHTKQKVQIQGGATMPDQSTAAAWFVQNILKGRFITEAKDKKFDIDNINKTVSKIVGISPLPPPAAYCSHCNKKFGTNSRPVECTRCSLYRHKTKCAPCPPYSARNAPNTTGQAPPSQNMGLSSGRSSTITSQIPTPPIIAFPAIPRTGTTTATSTSITTVSSPSFSQQVITSASAAQVGHTQTVPSVPITSVPTTTFAHSPPPTSSNDSPVCSLPLPPLSWCPPTAPIHSTPTHTRVSQPSPSHNQLNPLAAPFNTLSTKTGVSGKRKSNNLPATTAESMENEFLKKELNMAKTEIVKLEAKLKDNERSLFLYKARVKLFEEREHKISAEKYFGASPDSSPSSSSSASPSSESL